jgi:hypothetical protein
MATTGRTTADQDCTVGQRVEEIETAALFHAETGTLEVKVGPIGCDLERAEVRRLKSEGPPG